MTLIEALNAVREAGGVLDLDEAGPVLRGHVPADVVTTLREHRDRVSAILQLRQIHTAMGFSPEDVAFIEGALLSGRMSEIRIAVRAPEGAPA